MIKKLFFYLLILSFPAFLGLVIWQSVRYADLERDILRLEKAQEEWIENNKRLIANITVLSSPARIERIARDELGLEKKKPEEVLQISIGGSNAADSAGNADGAGNE